MKCPTRSKFLNISILAAGVFAFSWAAGTPAFAQRGGAHFGGGAHLGGGARLSAPHIAPAPRVAAPARIVPAAPHVIFSRPLTPVSPFQAGTGIGILRPRGPIRPIRPIAPIIPLPIYGYGFGGFGSPFFGLGYGWGWGLGLNSFWTPGCDPFWTLDYDCYGGPFYNFGPSYTYLAPSAPYTYTSPYNYALPSFAIYGAASAQNPQLYMKDGTVYNVTDYWLEKDQIHFNMLEDSGTKSVEHTVDFDDLDVQKTIDVDSQRGFRFVLRNEPLQQYLRDNPGVGSQDMESPPPTAQAPR